MYYQRFQYYLILLISIIPKLGSVGPVQQKIKLPWTKRCLRLPYNDKTSSFEELLEKYSSVSIHIRNVQILATEMFKVYRNMSPPTICKIFNRREIILFEVYLVQLKLNILAGTTSLCLISHKYVTRIFQTKTMKH